MTNSTQTHTHTHTHTHTPLAYVHLVAQDEASYCKDIHCLVVWCEGVCGQAIRQAALLEGQEGAGRRRKRKIADTAPSPDLSECDQSALKVAQVRCSPLKDIFNTALLFSICSFLTSHSWLWSASVSVC